MAVLRIGKLLFLTLIVAMHLSFVLAPIMRALMGVTVERTERHGHSKTSWADDAVIVHRSSGHQTKVAFMTLIFYGGVVSLEHELPAWSRLRMPRCRWL